MGRVIHKQLHAVATRQAQGGGELNARGTGAVDRHAGEGMARFVLQAEQHIAQREPHGTGEAGEQHPQQQPTATGRKRQSQQHSVECKQQHQQGVAAGEAIQRQAAHVAGEALVLAAEGIQRQAD
jgi:hypothetical protein